MGKRLVQLKKQRFNAALSEIKDRADLYSRGIVLVIDSDPEHNLDHIASPEDCISRCESAGLESQ